MQRRIRASPALLAPMPHTQQLAMLGKLVHFVLRIESTQGELKF